MSLYRTLIAAVAAIIVASPVVAAEATSNALQTSSMVSTDNASTPRQSTVAEKVNLNKATAKELLKVKGLNASRVRSILSYRKKHGEFKSVDELVSVKGMSKVKADELKAIQQQLSI